MVRRPWLAPIVLLVAAAASAESSFRWPPAEKWRTETIPFTGVAKEKKYPIDPSRFAASIHAVPGVLTKSGHEVRALAGTVDSYDAFATGAPIVLNLEVWVWDCPVAGKRAALVLASPKPVTAPTWDSLRKRRDEFVCHGAPGANHSSLRTK